MPKANASDGLKSSDIGGFKDLTQNQMQICTLKRGKLYRTLHFFLSRVKIYQTAALAFCMKVFPSFFFIIILESRVE